MKNRIGSFLCAAALLMGLANLPATACAGNMGTSSSGHEDPDFDDWLVVTGRDFAGACLSYMLEGIPIKAERLQIAFPSTMETIELHQGKIIRYTGLIHAPGAQGRKNLRKMAFSPEGPLKAIGGDKDKALMVYAPTRIWVTSPWILRRLPSGLMARNASCATPWGKKNICFPASNHFGQSGGHS